MNIQKYQTMKVHPIEVVSVSSIRGNEKNPRYIKEKEFKELIKSVRNFPQMMEARPIIVDENNVILGGNMRYKAALELGYKDVHIIRITDATEEQKREFIIKDNVSKGEWDWDMLANEWDMQELDEWGLEMPVMFDEEKGEVDDDEFSDDKNITTDIVLGDLIEIGSHRLLCGSSTNQNDVDRLMNNRYAELLFTSPPYSDMREYNGGKDLSVENICEFITSYYAYAEYQAINLGIQRKDNDIHEYWNEYIDKGRQNGYKLLSWNVWAKPTAGSVGNQSAFIPIAHEWIFVFGKKFKHINRTWERRAKVVDKKIRGRRQKDGSIKASSVGYEGELKEMESVLFLNTELGNIRKFHPATFPIELPAEYIKAITKTNDLIVEPFMGSGTTMVASHQLNRVCYGMELDPIYCQVIINRMHKLDPSLQIKINGNEYTPKSVEETNI